MSNELDIIQEKSEIMFLGSKGLCKYDGNNLLNRVEHNVELSYKSGHFCKITTWVAGTNGNQGSSVDKYIMQAEGFEYLNKFAGLVEVQEDYFTMNDIKYTNPHIEFDGMGKKSKVFAKVTLAGPNNNGQIHFSSSLIVYDTADELITALLIKVKKIGKSFGYMTTKESYLEDKKENRQLVYYPIDEILGIAVDLGHADAVQIYTNYQQQKGNVEKKAKTVAKRNSFRKHPATSVYTLNAQPKKNSVGTTIDLIANVKVTTWLNISNDYLKSQIDEYLKGGITVKEDVVNVKEEEPEVMGDGFGPSEDETFIVADFQDIIEKETTTVMAASEETEKAELIKFIVDGSKIVGGDLQEKISKMNLQEMNIIELMNLKQKMNEEATQ